MTRDERGDLEKALRQSRRALPFEILLAVGGAVVLWALHHYLRLPMWVALILALFVVLGAIGDAINIPYTKRQLRRLDTEEERRSMEPRNGSANQELR